MVRIATDEFAQAGARITRLAGFSQFSNALQPGLPNFRAVGGGRRDVFGESLLPGLRRSARGSAGSGLGAVARRSLVAGGFKNWAMSATTRLPSP